MTNPNQDGREFSFDTIQNFDEHIAASIPGLPFLYDIIGELSREYVQSRTNVYDLGCSTGKLLKHVKWNNQHLEEVDYIGFDIAENLLPKDKDGCNFFERDITDPTIELYNTGFVSLIFVLQFLPLEKRQPLINKIWRNLNHGGCIVIAEKFISPGGYEQEILSKTHRQLKAKRFSGNDIVGKEDRLRDIMHPDPGYFYLPAKCRDIDRLGERFTIWQSLNFRAYALVKI